MAVTETKESLNGNPRYQLVYCAEGWLGSVIRGLRDDLYYIVYLCTLPTTF